MPEDDWEALDDMARGDWRAFARVALDAARPHLATEIAAEIVERYIDTSQGILLCSDFRQAADFVRERFVSVRPDNEEAKP